MPRGVATVIKAPGRLWWASLPLRVTATTLAASIVVLFVGGLLVMRQASKGILDAKLQASVAEASTALTRMQSQLNETDLQQASLYERLSQLAEEASGQPGQYQVMIQGPVSVYISSGITIASVPNSLQDSLGTSESMWVTPTRVVHIDGGTEPGLAIGAHLHAPSGESFPVYFIFPQSHEAETLAVVQRALVSTGALLVLALAAVSWLASRQITSPIRQASAAARRIAAGDLGERLDVHGTDDLASLATSMNNMASELQKQIAQLEDLSRLQQRFVSDVSHELRTPLTTIKMASELLYERRDEFEPTAGRTAELLHDEIDRFDILLGDLLEISRFDAGAAVLSLDSVDLVELVREEVAAQQSLADRMGTELRIHAQGPALVECDTRRIQRVLRNLLTNAIEHGERAPIDIRVAADDMAAAISVRDHGVGFLAGQSQQVFHRFWRADPSRVRTVGGTGLGLAISQEDAQLHHGWLQAWGRPGRGALFRLTLPLRQDQVLASSPLPLRPDDLDGSWALPRDDEPPDSGITP